MRFLQCLVVLVLLAGCGGGGGNAPASTTPQPRTVTFPIASAFTGQTYDVTVLLPIGYDKTASRSPVIYALDGTDRYARLAQPLSAQKYENVVMVSISANGAPRRFIDFSMPGAAPYYRFLTEELIPKIDAEYHTDINFRVLTGHSLSMRGFQGLDIKYTAYAFDHVAMDGPSFAESLAFALGPPAP